MIHFAEKIARLLLVVGIALTALWMALALWFRLPAPEALRLGAALLAGALGIYAIIGFVRRDSWRPVLAYAFALAAVATWWSTIQAPAQGDWAPDVAHQATGVIDGDTLTITNARDFTWRSNTDFTERWETRRYDLTKLKSLDFYTSHWSSPAIAHFIVSFGFENGDYLSWSIEVRRSKTGVYSPIADLFKSDPLVIIATNERDVVAVRTNVRGEDAGSSLEIGRAS